MEESIVEAFGKFFILDFKGVDLPEGVKI